MLDGKKDMEKVVYFSTLNSQENNNEPKLKSSELQKFLTEEDQQTIKEELEEEKGENLNKLDINTEENPLKRLKDQFGIKSPMAMNEDLGIDDLISFDSKAHNANSSYLASSLKAYDLPLQMKVPKVSQELEIMKKNSSDEEDFLERSQENPMERYQTPNQPGETGQWKKEEDAQNLLSPKEETKQEF